ncbi:hypothetical protein CDV31_016614 [Fusarium ambrosium]|uniref:Uncharacterized protein n=1 Tax=Fusarium ambrosium TaxID=131363 RepID=A0A428S5W5_9HYPO|nr:hypothetical protein CDV31_016614 [Fusarium ambrosium]
MWPGSHGVVVNPQEGLMEWSVFDMDPYVNPYVDFRGVALNPKLEEFNVIDWMMASASAAWATAVAAVIVGLLAVKRHVRASGVEDTALGGPGTNLVQFLWWFGVVIRVLSMFSAYGSATASTA